jgi:hypothetical protein
MTIDTLLKSLFEGNILTAIDLSESIDQYIADRSDEANVHTEEYNRWEDERKVLETELLLLFHDREEGRKKLLQYNELFAYKEGESGRQYFIEGFYEAVKLILVLVEELHKRSSK